MIGRVIEGGRGYYWPVHEDGRTFLHMQDARRSHYREVREGDVFEFDVEVQSHGDRRAVNLRRVAP